MALPDYRAPPMRLKRLETYGFKSFADRLTFDFEDGITAIIGPNGCGKSNVVDAIKWVIGEQSAKALRGESMTDVIFNGCATRRGYPFCEVTLVMDQLNHALPGIDSDEIAITRRLFRDGSSSYFLNGTPCRLKDIKEIFLGTGMGTSAYAVIEQGRVGFILESNTKDRRLILEEAAGISRYKARRNLASRKLERVQGDLQRIGEVLGEVRRRSRAVARQAATAIRFKELTGEARELRLAFALEEFGRLSEDLGRHRAHIDQLAGGLAGDAARLGQVEAALAEADQRLMALEAELRTAGEARAAAVGRRDVADHRVNDARKRLGDLAPQEKSDPAAAASLEARRVESQTAVAQAREEAAAAALEAGDGPAGTDGPLAQARAAHDAALGEVDRLVANAESAKAKQVECLRELSRIEAEQNRLGSAKIATGERRQRLEERSGGQTGQLAQAMAAAAEAAKALETAMIAAADAHRDLDTTQRERDETSAETGRLDQELSEVKHQQARAETGLRLYREQEQRAEGVQRGVRDVLGQTKNLKGIVGMVADLVRIGDQDVVAIETALGAQAQNIVTETQVDAKAAIDFLKRERRGRATFLPLDDIRGGERAEQQLLREPGVIGIASRLVEYAPAHRAAIEYLLGNVLVVETIDDAIALRRRHRTGARIVTRDGDIINAGGAMTGGKQQGQESGGVVSRKHEIARAEEQLTDLTRRAGDLTAKRDEAKRKTYEKGIAVEEIRRRIQLADRAAADARGNAMARERDRLHLEDAASGFGAELEEIAGELGRLEAEGRDLLGQHEWFSALSRKQESNLAELAIQVAQAGKIRDERQEAVSLLRLDAATAAERREAAKNHVAHLERQLDDLSDRLAEITLRLASAAERRDELRQVMESAAAVFAEAAAEAKVQAEACDTLVKARDTQRNAMEEDRQEARILQARAKATERERQEIELKANECAVRLENLTSQVLDSHQVDLAEAHTHYQRPGDFDGDALKTRLHAVEKELQQLGPVNLAAIDELAEVQEREKYLDTAHTDLTKAMETLTTTIEDLNTTCGKLFNDTYKQVRANFQILFRKLFGGGRADLQLELKDAEGNAVDPLEAGLEILACPPGKNPKIITQLSGGEKALTAIALLFAVYQTKPSPFCILDEVDAPLDEANVDVYNGMIREFTRAADGTRGSQFIVITHKKRTMQRADAIYGITQNEPGVSTKISVRFEDVEKGLLAGSGGELAATVRGSGPFAG